MDSPRYKAFISYSHQDEKWARWLQSALERYRVPGRLVGKTGARGAVPARIRPVFRDREDLSSASDLTAELLTVMERSETMLVICSPASAASRWVNEEIRQFRNSGREEQIFALIVDGDPAADEGPDVCFPPALVESEDGTRREPLAADVRRYADGKHLSKLKIVAGILGVRLDELRQRDAQRRLRRRLFYGAASLVLASLVAWLVYSEASTRQAAQAQRANTEDLLSFMLGDLQRLDPIAGLEDFTYEDMEHALYADRLGFSSLESDALISRAIEWRETGLDLNWEGKTDEALERYMHSRAAIIEVYRRDGKTPRVIFELGQAEYYVGEAYLHKGELERTRQHWSHYGALTRRLLNAEPKNPVYVMELASTLLNLGALEQMFAVPDNQKSLTLLQAAVQYTQMALVLDPDNTENESSLATALEWQSDAWLQVCSLGNALEGRLETESLRRDLLALEPDEASAKISLAFTLSGLSGVQQQIGLNENSIESLREAVAILVDVHRDEPDNEYIEWESLYREARLARIMVEVGALGEAGEIVLRVANRIGELSREGELADQQRVVEGKLFDLDHARLLLATGQVEQGEALLRDTTARIADMVRNYPDFRDSLIALVRASFFYWEQFGTRPPGSSELLATLYPEDFKAEACTDADRAARIAVMEGDREKALRMTDYAVGKGYFEARFIRFCRQYELCELP